MEIDAFKLTLKLAGTKTREASIASAPNGRNYKFEGLPNDQRLSNVTIVGRADDSAEVPPIMGDLRTFFRTLCNGNVRTIDQLTFVDQLPANVVQMLSDQLFRNVAVLRLELRATKMGAFDFASLKALTNLTIGWSNGRPADNNAYQIDMGRLKTLLENNNNLKYVQLPAESYPAIEAIIEKRKQADEFELRFTGNDGKANQFMKFTKTALTTTLDSKRLNNMLRELPPNRFESVEVELAFGHVEATAIQAPFWVRQKSAKSVYLRAADIGSDQDRVNVELSESMDPFIFAAQRTGQLAGAEWTHLKLDTFVYTAHDIYRIGKAVTAFQQQLKNLKELAVRYIFQNKTWQPDEHLEQELRVFGKYTCNGLPYERDVNLKLRILTFKCKF